MTVKHAPVVCHNSCPHCALSSLRYGHPMNCQSSFWAAHFPVTFGKIIPFICLIQTKAKRMWICCILWRFVCLFVFSLVDSKVVNFLGPVSQTDYLPSATVTVFLSWFIKIQFFQSISHAVEPFTQTITVWEHYFNSAFFMKNSAQL